MSQVGRPGEYSEKLAEEICSKLAEGRSLVSICAEEGMPTRTSIYRWIEANKAFSDKYAKAKADGLEYLAEELIDIADNGENDWMERNSQDNQGWIQNGEAIARSRLRVDTRKWILSKLVAKRFGDKIENVHTGPDGGPIQVTKIELIPLVKSTNSTSAQAD